MDNNTNDQRRKHKLIEYANRKSLEEINGTVEVPKGKGFWKTLLAYSGPGALVAVGYMDLQLVYFDHWWSGIRLYFNDDHPDFKFDWSVAQYMAAKLGIVSEMDLAQAIRARTGRRSALFYGL